MGFRRILPPGVPAGRPRSDHQPEATAPPLSPTVSPAPFEEQDEVANDPDYKVGRGKPPLHARWKKGQSGNPAGKKPGRLNNASIALEVFGEVMTVQTPGGERRMNTVALAYYKLREMVAKGDLKAIGSVIAIWQQVMPDPLPSAETTEPALSSCDEAILKGLLEQLGDAPQIKGRGRMVTAGGAGGAA